MANAFANAVYNEDQKKKLMEIYKNQGAGAVTSAALGMMAQGAATGGASAKSQRINEALTAANANASPLVKSLTSERTNAIMDANARKTTPYMAAIAAADTASAPTSTQGGRMEDGSFRLGDGSTYDSLQGAIDANAAKTRAKNQYEITTGENGETLYDGMPLTNGTGILAQKGDAGKITSSLAYPDAHVRTADGRLIGSDYSGGPDANYHHGLVAVSKLLPDGNMGKYIYDYDTMTDDELWGIGMVRDKNGGARIANDNDYIQYAAMNGASPDAIATMYDNVQRRISGNAQNTTPQNATPQGGNVGGTTQRSTAPLPQGSQSTAPRDTGVSQGNGYGGGNGGGTYPSGTAGYTPYQLALDQYDYGKAPEWTGTEYERQRDEALQNARNMRWDGSDYQNQRDELLKNAMNPYEGSPYDQQRDDALAAYGEAWQGSEYQPKRDEALQRAENMQWNYDPNADPVWQALQKQYRREGDRATRNALGQAASMTGGVPSSYAVTAASQAGDYYASQLSDRLPQVYQDAYNRYLQEFQRQMGISDQYQGFDDREYSRWADQQGKNLDLADRYNQYGQQDYNQYMDRVSQQLQGADRMNGYDQTEYQRYLDQYGQELDAADRLNGYGATEYDRYRDRLGQWNTDRNFTYGLNRDAVSDARYADETAYERAWNEENRDYSRNYQARRDAILDNRADREWAQELTEYADSQNWKATEWQQYLREYEDQLSEKEREWVYQMSRDAEDDKRYWTDYEYQKTRDAEADKRYWDESDYKKHRDEITDQQYYDERDYQHKQDELDWKYKQDEFNYKKEQDEKSWDYTEQQDAYQKYLDAYDMGQKETESGNQEYDDAIAFLRTYGVVGGRYADILGVPPGTTWDDYWKQYGYDPSAQRDSGGYTGGGGNPPPQTEPPTAPETDPESNSNLFEFSNERHPNGNKMTKGFRSKMAELKADKAGGASDEEIENKVRQLIADHVITNYEGGLILYELGYHVGGGRQSHGIQDLTTEPFGE